MPGQLWICLLAIFLLTGCHQEVPTGKEKKGKAQPQEEKQRDYPQEKEFIPDIPLPPAPYTGPIKYCFEKRDGENAEDITTLRLTFDHDSVTGYYDVIPHEQAPTHGVVEGISLGRILHLILKSKRDGNDRTEQLIYKFENNKLYRKTGKMALRDGMYVLENPPKAFFKLYMERIDCK